MLHGFGETAADTEPSDVTTTLVGDGRILE